MEAIKDGAPQLYPECPNNIAFEWEFGDGTFKTSQSYGVGPIYGPTSPGATPAGIAPHSARSS